MFFFGCVDGIVFYFSCGHISSPIFFFLLLIFILVHGNDLVCTEVADWSLGLSVCYDVRFPGLFQALRWPEASGVHKNDDQKSITQSSSSSSQCTPSSPVNRAEVFLVPSAFTPRTGAPHWEVLLRARAIETQCYVIAAAQAGKHNEKRTSYGHSMIVDPWGTVGK